jgi:hypothetical protein
MNIKKKAGDTTAKYAEPIYSVPELSAIIVAQNLKKLQALMILRKKKLYIQEILKLILDFLPDIHYCSNTIKKHIRNYINNKKVKKWGRGIFIDTHNYEDIYCYMPAQDCRIWRTKEINQNKYVEYCSVCEKKFTMGPYSLSSMVSFGGHDNGWEEFELVQSYCIKCHTDESSFLKSTEYKLMNSPFTVSEWIWPSKKLTNPLYIYLGL